MKFKFSITDWFVIYMIRDFVFSKYEGIDDITVLSLNMLSKPMNSIPLLLNGILIKCLMWLISECTDEEHTE